MTQKTNKLLEKGLLQKVANVFSNKAPSADRINNAEKTLNAGNEKPEDKPTKNMSTGESATQQVLGKIFSVPSDSARAVLFLNDADLKDRYLTSNGEQKIVDAATDEQIAATFPHADFQLNGGTVNPEDSFLRIAKNFDLSAVEGEMVSSRPFAVLLNVPKNVAAHFDSKEPTDLEEAKRVFLETISHANYVATLNARAIKKSGVGALSDADEREELFDVKKFITAYPVRAVIDAAREEQGERDSHKKLTPSEVKDDGAAPKAEPTKATPLTRQDMQNAAAIASDARKIFWAAAAKGRWPTSPEGLQELRDKLIAALTTDPRIDGKKNLIPEIVKAFYSNQVKTDRRYNDLVELLKNDADFMKLAGGEVSDSAEQSPEGETAPAEKSAADVAKEIADKGPDFADEVAKILSKKSPAKKEVPAAPEKKYDVPVFTKKKANES